MPARRWNQRRQTLEPFERRQHPADAATGTGLDAFIDPVFGIDFTPALQCEGRASAVAQQPFPGPGGRPLRRARWRRARSRPRDPSSPSSRRLPARAHRAGSARAADGGGPWPARRRGRTDRQPRQNVVSQMGGSFDHPPSITSGTDAAAFARPGDEKIVTALGASGAGKTIGENPAFEIATELAFDRGRTGGALPTVTGQFEPGGEVHLHGAIEHGTFGPATAIDGSASGRAGGSHGDSGRALEMQQLYAFTVVGAMPSGGSTRALERRGYAVAVISSTERALAAKKTAASGRRSTGQCAVRRPAFRRFRSTAGHHRANAAGGGHTFGVGRVSSSGRRLV